MCKALKDVTHISTSQDQFLSVLRQVLQSRREVLFAYIFGSSVKGVVTRESDVDIAVYLKDGIDPADFVFSVMPQIVRLTGCDKIDLVVLNAAPLSLRYVVQRDGLLIFERSQQERIDFEVRTRILFWDFVPHLRTYSSYLLKRVEEGTFGT